MQNTATKYQTDLRSRAKGFALEIIQLTNLLPNKRSSWIITDQLLRSAMSIGANITEARGSTSRLEYRRFFAIALKSANETEYWLELLAESNIVRPQDINKITKEIIEIERMLASSIIKLKNS